MSSWQISGQYAETCSCTLLCPCISSNLTARPSDGDCKAAVAMRIDKGAKDGVQLDGISFVVMLHSPGPMADGNIKVGLIIDEAADDKQVAAIKDIATGAVGGPMAALAPLVGEIAGVQREKITFESKGLHHAVRAGNALDQICDGLPSVVNPDEPIYIDNVAHPANSRLAMAKATRSKMDVFGIKWDDSTGTRNGHFAPFNWSG